LEEFEQFYLHVVVLIFKFILQLCDGFLAPSGGVTVVMYGARKLWFISLCCGKTTWQSRHGAIIMYLNFV